MLSPRCCCLSSEQNFNPTCGFFILWYVHTCTPYLLTILKDKYVQVIMLVFYKLSSGIFWFQKWERKIQTNLELPENGIICGWKINHFWGHVLLKSRHLHILALPYKRVGGGGACLTFFRLRVFSLLRSKAGDFVHSIF